MEGHDELAPGRGDVDPPVSATELIAAGGDGLRRYELTPRGGVRLIGHHALTPGALYMLIHPSRPIAYVAQAGGTGQVIAVQLMSGEVQARPSGGATPCHLALSNDHRHLLTANYTGGTVAVRLLDDDGGLGALTHVLTLPPRDARPHHIAFGPSGRVVLVTDLAGDLIRSYRFSRDSGQLTELSASPSRTAGGSGPRSLAFDRYGYTWCSNEKSSTVTRYRVNWITGSLQRTACWPASRSGSTVANHPGLVAGSLDGRYIYVANRGHNTLTVFVTDQHCAGPVAEVDSGGEWPSDLVVHDSWLYVAHRDTDSISRLGLHDGIPSEPRRLFRVPRPSCVRAVPNRSSPWPWCSR